MKLVLFLFLPILILLGNQSFIECKHPSDKSRSPDKQRQSHNLPADHQLLKEFLSSTAQFWLQIITAIQTTASPIIFKYISKESKPKQLPTKTLTFWKFWGPKSKKGKETELAGTWGNLGNLHRRFTHRHQPEPPKTLQSRLKRMPAILVQKLNEYWEEARFAWDNYNTEREAIKRHAIYMYEAVPRADLILTAAGTLTLVALIRASCRR